MSDPLLQYATAVCESGARNDNLRDHYVFAWLESRRELDALRARYAEQSKLLNAAIHERDALREAQSRTARPASPPPELTVFCNEPGCTSPPLTIQVAPPEDCLGQWVTGRGWQWVDESEQYCGGHKR